MIAWLVRRPAAAHALGWAIPRRPSVTRTVSAENDTCWGAPDHLQRLAGHDLAVTLVCAVGSRGRAVVGVEGSDPLLLSLPHRLAEGHEVPHIRHALGFNHREDTTLLQQAARGSIRHLVDNDVRNAPLAKLFQNGVSAVLDTRADDVNKDLPRDSQGVHLSACPRRIRNAHRYESDLEPRGMRNHVDFTPERDAARHSTPPLRLPILQLSCLLGPNCRRLYRWYRHEDWARPWYR